MNHHRYILEPYNGMKSRYNCPECNHRSKSFSIYIDTETGEYLNELVGRCNRESNCSYHFTPKQYFEANHISFDKPNYKPTNRKKLNQIIIKPTFFIPSETLKGSLKNFETNNFITYLNKLFGERITLELISKYFILNLILIGSGYRIGLKLRFSKVVC